MMMRKKSLLWQYLPTYNTNYRLLCVHACTYLPSFLAAGSTTQLISKNFLQNYLNLTWSCSFKVISSDVLFINSVVLSLIFFFFNEKKKYSSRKAWEIRCFITTIKAYSHPSPLHEKKIEILNGPIIFFLLIFLNEILSFTSHQKYEHLLPRESQKIRRNFWELYPVGPHF